MKKVLIISSDVIGKKMAGPGIRYYNMAKQLAHHYQVTLAIPNYDRNISSSGIFDDCKINVIGFKQIKAIYKSVDSIIIQGETLWRNQYLKKSKAQMIIDLYDPFVLEIMEIFSGKKEATIVYKNSLNILVDQLKYGDYFICASNKQKDFWLGALTVLYRINPHTYENDKTLSKLIGIVPFGLPDTEAVHNRKALKGVYKSIKEDDTVIVWGGGIWEWFDPITLIKAMKIVSQQRDDIKLFFMGTKHPNSDVGIMGIVDETIQLSNSMGLTDRFVFFNDWVDYDDRHNYLLEADIGISLHKNHVETRFSFRTRILDYMWTSLPIITNDGDLLSEVINDNNIGCVIQDLDEKKLAQCILQFPKKKLFADNFRAVKENYKWSNMFDELTEYISNPSPKQKKNDIDLIVIKKIKYLVSRVISSILNGDFFEKIKKKIKR